MPINGITLNEDATSGSVVGGTSITLTDDGKEVKQGIHVMDAAEADFTIRTNATFKTRNPVPQSDGSYTKAKRTMSLVVPRKLVTALPVGSVVHNLIRIEIEAHPETTAAELTSLHLLGAQLLMDADTADFLSAGSLA